VGVLGTSLSGVVANASAAEHPTGPPLNETAPTISGMPAEGKKVKASKGLWSGAKPLKFTLQWTLCNASGGECGDIAGAEGAGYKPVQSDVGHTLRLRVTASNPEGALSVTSAPSGVVAATAPKRKGRATLSTRAPVDGRVLTVGNGTFKGTAPFTYAYQWELCVKRTCSPIAGATEAGYRARSEDIGKTLRAIVTAHNSAGAASEKTRHTGKVVAGTPLNLEAPAISGTPLIGQTLEATPGAWVGTGPFTYEYQWRDCNLANECNNISGANESHYTAGLTDLGDNLDVVVTAKGAIGSAVAVSEETSLTGTPKTPPANVIAPLILGLTITGDAVEATTGTWTGTEPIAYTYQWEICNASGSECEEAAGATESKFTIPSGHVGDTLRVTVTAENVVAAVSKTSEASLAILGQPPVNTKLPAVSGTATAGQLLNTSNGEWSGTEPILYEYSWEICDSSGGACKEISGQALPLLLLGVEDVGHTIRSVVKAKNIAGSDTATSEPTAVVSGVLPSNVIAPIVLGLTVTGDTVNATTGTWTGTEPIIYSYQWEICNASGAECKEVSGATEASFVIPTGHVGETLRVIVTAKNVAGSVPKTSEASLAILGQPPVNMKSPAVSGTTTAGQILSTSNGEWTGTEPILFTYVWERCNASGASCAEIAGQILPLYTLTTEDIGHTIRSIVTGKNIAGSTPAPSAATAEVKGVPPANVVLPLVTGLTTTGSTLSTTNGTWTGTEPITFTYQWEICNALGVECKEVSGATKATFAIPSGHVGSTVRVVVTAKNVAGVLAKESLQSTPILL
jgi:hypothetical protein